MTAAIGPPATAHARHLAPAERRIRAQHGGRWLIDTTDAHILFERGRHPALVVPREQLPIENSELAKDDVDGSWVAIRSPWHGNVRIWPEPPADLPQLVDLTQVPIEAAAEWFEEDQPFIMIRDPYRRLDIIESSRQISIEVDGLEIARSTNARLVLETGMPALWYLPLSDVNTERITPADHTTECQYKGQASYWNIDLHNALMWGYKDPISSASQLAGYVCITPWSPAVHTTLEQERLNYETPNPDWSNPLATVIAS